VPRAACILIAAAIAVGAGCGGDDGQGHGEAPDLAVQGPETVGADNVARVLRAENSINAHCGLSRDLPGSTMSLRAAIRTLQDVYRQSPSGIYASGMSTKMRSMKVVLRDDAAKLRKCGKAAAAEQLESALKGG
jgi:hypothetical protein